MRNDNKTRIFNSSRNIIVAIIFQAAVAILSFVERNNFVSYLTADYLGLSNLFTSVLSVLSVAELGIGTALGYCLYLPLAENNTERIRSIMKYLSHLYKMIGSIILLIGVILIPFLRFLIKSDTINLTYIYKTYSIYLLGSSFAYFFSYKSILVDSNQEQYVSTAILSASTLIQYTIQIFILKYYQNFTLYILTYSICNVTKYIVISILVNKKFPYIKSKNKIEQLPKDIKNKLKKDIKALFFHKIGGAVIGSSDSLIISTLFGLTILGIYANYQLITIGVASGVAIFYGSITASIGNIIATEPKEKTLQYFYTISHHYLLAIGALCGTLILVFTDLINLLFSKAQTFGMSTIIFLGISQYAYYSRRITLTFESGYGIYWEDRFKPLFEVFVNILASVILAKFMGLNGVILGTILSNIGGPLWIEIKVLFKHGFQHSPFKFAKDFILCFTSTVLATFTSMLCYSFLPTGHLIVKIILIILISLIIHLFFAYCFFPKKTTKAIKTIFFKIRGLS